MMAGAQRILLFGGSGVERLVSVATAQHVSHALPGARHWFLDPTGRVHEIASEQLLAHQNAFTVQMQPSGVPYGSSLRAALETVNSAEACVFIALHGEDGESGELQTLLDGRRVAYTGSDAKASALAYDKASAKKLARSIGVRTAESVELTAADWQQELARLFASWGGIVIKPRKGGSSIGLHILRTEAELDQYCAAAEEHTESLLVEQFVTGRELTIGVIERGTEAATLALPPSEVITDAQRTFDYAGKYLSSGATEITPADIREPDRLALAAAALRVHAAAGCRGYSRSDFILDENGPVFLEINTLPGLTRQSFLPQQLHAAGLSFEDFIEEQLRIARSRVDPRVQTRSA